MSREKRKNLALSLMREWNIHPDYIKAFEEDDKITVFEEPFGAGYWADDEVMSVCKELEEQNLTVFAVLKGTYHMPFDDVMEATTYLYVSNNDVRDYEETGDLHDVVTYDVERKLYYTYAYVVGFSSESGSVAVAPFNGGLLRIY